jgi:hypothetical protein
MPGLIHDGINYRNDIMRLFFAVFITMLFWLLNLSAQQPVFIQNDFKKKEFGFGEITYIAAGDSVQNLLQAQDYSNRHFFCQVIVQELTWALQKIIIGCGCSLSIFLLANTLFF